MGVLKSEFVVGKKKKRLVKGEKKKNFYSKIETKILGKLLPNSFSKLIPKLVLASQYRRFLFFSIKKKKKKKIPFIW